MKQRATIAAAAGSAANWRTLRGREAMGSPSQPGLDEVEDSRRDQGTGRDGIGDVRPCLALEGVIVELLGRSVVMRRADELRPTAQRRDPEACSGDGASRGDACR